MNKLLTLILFIFLIGGLVACTDSSDLPSMNSQVIYGKLVELSGHFISVESEGEIKHYFLAEQLTTKKLIIGQEYYFYHSSDFNRIMKFSPANQEQR